MFDEKLFIKNDGMMIYTTNNNDTYNNIIITYTRTSHDERVFVLKK